MTFPSHRQGKKVTIGGLNGLLTNQGLKSPIGTLLWQAYLREQPWARSSEETGFPLGV
jgi:hypothetical protein